MVIYWPGAWGGQGEASNPAPHGTPRPAFGGKAAAAIGCRLGPFYFVP